MKYDLDHQMQNAIDRDDEHDRRRGMRSDHELELEPRWFTGKEWVNGTAEEESRREYEAKRTPPGDSPSPAELILAARSANGGWTRKQLAEWGVPWPPPRGWKRELERRWAANHYTIPSARCGRANETETYTMPPGHRGPCSWSYLRQLNQPVTKSITAGAVPSQKKEKQQ